jgi:imidazolonepropionase-like amidohydrolase
MERERGIIVEVTQKRFGLMATRHQVRKVSENMRQKIYHQFISPILLILLLSGMPQMAQQNTSPVKRVALRGARLLDVKNGRVINHPLILIDGNRITNVEPNLSVPDNVEVLDLGDVTILPGLIDCHTHLLLNADRNFGGDANNFVLNVMQLGTTKRALFGAAMGREVLEAGFTTVRDLGNSGMNGDVALRDAINAGWVTGPRMFVSTRALSAPGGQFGRLSPETQKIIEQEYVAVSGTEEARRAVRQAIYDGANLIKVIVDTGPRLISLEEMRVIVEEAHRVKLRVAAHVVSDQAARIAAEAGVDSIEHAYDVSDEVLKIMAAKRIFLVPTDGPIETDARLYVLPSEVWKQVEPGTKRFIERSRQRLERAFRAGVPIAFGTDTYYRIPVMTRGQAIAVCFRQYVASGMKPWDVIRAATINAAALIGVPDLIGSIEPEHFADIIAITGDPSSNITALENVGFVMKNGQIIKNTLTKDKR